MLNIGLLQMFRWKTVLRCAAFQTNTLARVHTAKINITAVLAMQAYNHGEAAFDENSNFHIANVKELSAKLRNDN